MKSTMNASDIARYEIYRGPGASYMRAPNKQNGMHHVRLFMADGSVWASQGWNENGLAHYTSIMTRVHSGDFTGFKKLSPYAIEMALSGKADYC